MTILESLLLCNNRAHPQHNNKELPGVFSFRLVSLNGDVSTDIHPTFRAAALDPFFFPSLLLRCVNDPTVKIGSVFS